MAEIENLFSGSEDVNRRESCTAVDEKLDDEVRITVVATGFDDASKAQPVLTPAAALEKNMPKAEPVETILTVEIPAVETDVVEQIRKEVKTEDAPTRAEEKLAADDPFIDILSIFRSK